MFLVLLFIWLFVSITPVNAANVAQGWTSGAATVVQSVDFQGASGESCRGHVEDVLIAEWNSINSVCMNGGKALNVGYLNFGGSYYGLVGFPYSNDVHMVDGLCGGTFCQYSPDKDMLVTIGQADFGVTDIIVFLNVSSRIRQVPSYGGTVRYDFDGSNPDYTFEDKGGLYIPYQAFSLSDNGKWIVTELRNKGLAIINTDTFSSRQIRMSGYQYGRGMDPSEDLAVSNDGKSVVLTGDNAGFHVIDVTPECGQDIAGDYTIQVGKTECPASDIGIGGIFQTFYYGEAPHFLGNGHELEVTIHTRSEGVHRVTFLEPGASVEHKLKLLALGDSFTSGEGETDASYYESGTNDTFDTCHLSKRSYPFLIGKALGIGDADVRSVACAGATTKDMLGSSDDYWGQGDRLGAHGLGLNEAAKSAAQDSALGSFQPGRIRQATFIGQYNPEKVIVGVGGNDAGLMGKLSSCAMPGTCEWAQGDGLRQTANEIKRLFDTLSRAYYQMSQLSPFTKFYAVGYPDVIDADGLCDPTTALLLDHTERVFIEHSLQYLNQVIRAASEKEGFTYLDIEHSLDGKRLCSGLNSTAMNGLRLGGDIAVISQLPMLKVIGAGTFHPTPVGQELVASTIISANPGLEQKMACGVEQESCSFTPEIEPPAYWGVRADNAIRDSYVTDFASRTDTGSNQLAIVVPDGVLEPGSSVSIEVHSVSVSLGSFTVGSRGGVVGKVPLPVNIESGFHALHLYGVSREGKLVDLYQFISVGQDGQALQDRAVGDISLPNNSSPIQELLASATTAVAVLGAQDIATTGTDLKDALSQTLHSTESALGARLLLWIAIVAGISTLSSTLCTILLLRRWAKPGS
jgi:hypothetical protein